MKINIKQKLLIFLLLPIAGLSYFFIHILLQERANLKIFNEMTKSIYEMNIASNLVHELQKERGMTSIFLSGGTNLAQLESYRETTDSVFESSRNEATFEKLYDFKERLERNHKEYNEIRRMATERKISSQEAIQKYTLVIGNLLEVHKIGAKKPTTAGFGKIMPFLHTIENSKESLGQFRAYNSAFISSHTPMKIKELQTSISLFEQGVAFLKSEIGFYSAEGFKELAGIHDSNEIKRFYQGYGKIIAGYQTGEYELLPDEFFDIVTQVINQVRGLLVIEYNNLNKNITAGKKTIMNGVIISMVIGFGLIIITLVGGYLITTFIAKPLLKIVYLLRDISQGEGDLTARLEIKTSDEIQVFAEYFNQFTGKLREIIHTSKGVGQDARRTGENLAENVANTVQVIQSINQNTDMLMEKVEELDTSVHDSSSSVSVISRSVSDIVARIEDQAASVNESSSSIEEMVASINTITSVTSTRKLFADEMTTKAKAGEEKMSELLESMNEISQDTQVIFEMIRVINHVAEQTDLLAMNAAIEAAHAGSSGKGFAVVADEIRNLAEATKQKSDEMSQHLNRIGEKINDSVLSGEETGETITELINGIVRLSDTMNELLSSMSEMKIGSDQILIALKTLISITDEIRSSSSSIAEQSSAVDNAMRTLKVISSNNREVTTQIANRVYELNESSELMARHADDNSRNARILETELGRFKT